VGLVVDLTACRQLRAGRRDRLDTLSAMAETSYASCGDLSLACQVFGDGPVELV
jgi:hypothetical protein